MSGDVARLQKELEHWKSLAEQYKQNFEAVQEDFSDFQSNSKDLESELEAQLVQQEKKTRELQANNQKLNMECETLKAKLEALQFESCDQVNRLEAQLNRVKAERDDMQRYIRELEQINDDLERAKRAALTSLEDFEKRLNETIERNAFLENELDEKESLKEYVQRLKEETRDLKQELKVKERPGSISGIGGGGDGNYVQRLHSVPSSGSTTPLLLSSPMIANGNITSMLRDQSPMSTPSRMTQSFSIETTDGILGAPTSLNGMHLTPNARISALNIVGDLLRKVGALESKLANCRRFSVDQQQQPPPTQTGANGLNSSPQKTNLAQNVVISS